MNVRVLNNVLLAAGVALAVPAVAQEGVQADADADEFISAEEARVHSEQVFDDAVEDEEEMTFEQFNAVQQGSETAAAEENTLGAREDIWGEADADDSDSLSRDEWMQWREQRFEEAAGDEGRVEAGLYETVFTRGMSGVDSGGDTSAGEAPDAAAAAGGEEVGDSSSAADSGTAGGGALMDDDGADAEALTEDGAGEDSSDPEDSGAGETPGDAND